MKSEDSKAWAWFLWQRHLMAIERVILNHGFNWCSDEYPVIEILDCECKRTLAKFEFTSFDQLEKDLMSLYV